MNVSYYTEQVRSIVVNIPSVQKTVIDNFALWMDVIVDYSCKDYHVWPVVRKLVRTVNSNEQGCLTDSELNWYSVLNHRAIR